MVDRNLLSDSEAREAALDPRRSFIVQAPAGSGKTELLVRRFLTLLPLVESPEEILAITFTRKAAAEMRKRVLSELEAGDLAQRLRILTIDAFCAALTRQMPVLSRFGAQPGIVENAREHYLEAAQRTIGELSEPARRLLLHLDNNGETAGELIAAMLARRDQWLRKTGVAPTRSELESAFQRERCRLLEKARALHPKASPEFADEMLTKAGTWRARNKEAQALAGNEALRLALLQLRKLPPERYSEEQWRVLAAIVELLPRAAAHLKVVFAERHETDFTEIAQGAVRALGKPDAPTDLMLSLDYRIKHILVDEFQDTSASQWELLKLLTSGWTMEGEMRDSGRTLFVVGDPMQSIYRFREAEVALFQDAQDGGLGALERLTLTTNFRSQAGLVSWFNASFPTILPPERDRGSGAVPYSPATPHPKKPVLSGDPVTWHNVADRSSESQKIVELVRNAEGRTAILVRNRNALTEIVPALKAAGIRYRAIEIEHLGEKQVVQDLYALTRALLHLGDRIAWLSLLRAPWLGLSLKKLFEIAGRDRFKTIWELIRDDLFLERFTRILAPAIANRERGSLRDRVEGVWLALGGPACVAGRTDLEDAETYLDELEKLEEGGALHDPAALRESLERLYALPDVDATDDDLQIMTIHKAKGLEFGTVIVPGLDRGPGGGDPPLLLFKELISGAGGLLLAPIKATGSEKDPAYSYLRDLHTEAEDMEASRLLYVAATRAERRLHLLACGKYDDHGAPRPPTAHTLLARAWPVAEPFFGEAPAEPAREAPEPKAITSINRLAPDFRMPPLPEPARWTSPPEGRDEEQPPFDWAKETARHAGIVVHAWLQRIAEDELRGWDAKRVDALRARFSSDLQRRGVAPADLDRAVNIVVNSLKNSLVDERGRWLLGPHPVARNEYRLRNGVRSFRIDRYIEDKDGTKWVADYKTSEHEGAGIEKFLDQQRERYAAQLDGYADAVGGARRGLYFPLHKGWRSW